MPHSRLEAEHPELKDLARKIKHEQSAEIEFMQGYFSPRSRLPAKSNAIQAMTNGTTMLAAEKVCRLDVQAVDFVYLEHASPTTSVTRGLRGHLRRVLPLPRRDGLL